VRCASFIPHDPVPPEIEAQVARMRPRRSRGVVSPLSSLPQLQSLPDAAASLYIKFDGEITPFWSFYQNINTPAFDRDGDPTTFSDDEIATIRDIWTRVAEYYSPLNINVTTVAPSDPNTTFRVVVGGDGSWYGSAAGIAFVGSYRGSPKVGFAFSSRLGGDAKYTSVVIAHEAGHGFGLHHQKVYDSSGNLVSEYNQGSNGISPIMGTAYYGRPVWYIGPSWSATMMQNDLELITSTNNFGYRPDEHSNSYSAGTALTASNGAITGTSVIEKPTDVDYLPFASGEGTADLKVTIDPVRSSLDVAVDLKDALGNVLMTATPDGQGLVNFQTFLSANFYSLSVRSASAGTGSPQYAGFYQFSLIIPPGAPQGGNASAPAPPETSLQAGNESVPTSETHSPSAAPQRCAW
jgi:hypothetical protein